jgi:hypothetical protein
MSKTTAPLLSFGAGGAIAKTQVYSSWRGVSYVRKYVVPANPKSVNQEKTRTVFAYLSNVWKNSSSILQAPWTLFSQGQPFYNRNAFIGQNTKALRPGTTMAAFIGSPGAKGGVAPVAITATGAAGKITVAFTLPAIPTGWAIAAGQAVAIPSGDPHSTTDYQTFAAQNLTTPYTVEIDSLSAGNYEVSAWLEWTKPDGSQAFSASVNATAVVS